MRSVESAPFVAGLDSFLPGIFGRLHPKWRTPHIALLTQAGISVVFVILGQAGTSVRGAYDVLVSMSVISYFIPFLFMFAAMIKLQREGSSPEVIRVPGGRPAAMVLAGVGFVTTSVAIVLACVPADDEVNKTLAVLKIVGLSIVLLALGALVFALGNRRAEKTASRRPLPKDA
jgi:amino acid transporter